jgi:hypothetical protein
MSLKIKRNMMVMSGVGNIGRRGGVREATAGKAAGGTMRQPCQA